MRVTKIRPCLTTSITSFYLHMQQNGAATSTNNQVQLMAPPSAEQAPLYVLLSIYLYMHFVTCIFIDSILEEQYHTIFRLCAQFDKLVNKLQQCKTALYQFANCNSKVSKNIRDAEYAQDMFVLAKAQLVLAQRIDYLLQGMKPVQQMDVREWAEVFQASKKRKLEEEPEEQEAKRTKLVVQVEEDLIHEEEEEL